MTYKESVAYIHSLLRFGIQPGLINIKGIMKRLGNPQNSLKCVHIAGTSGKGSVSRMISGIAAAAGYRTGLFISPFVVDFLERIQVNNTLIKSSVFAAAATRVKAAAEAAPRIPITEFEAITAAAFICFKQEKCDLVVLETGLGGRLDATNVINTPVCSVITPVSLDHVEILGATYREIAAEKCGIIKPSGRTVCYPVQQMDAMEVIRSVCREQNNELILPEASQISVIQSSLSGSEFLYKGGRYTAAMPGEHQVYNAVTAIEAAAVLHRQGFHKIGGPAVTSGIGSAVLPARIEVISNAPPVILDGAHNADKITALCDTVGPYIKGRDITLIIGMLRDKDIDSALEALIPLAGLVVTVPVKSDRAVSPCALRKMALQYSDNVIASRSLDGALELANQAGKGVLIAGSLYLAGAIRQKAIKKFS